MTNTQPRKEEVMQNVGKLLRGAGVVCRKGSISRSRLNRTIASVEDRLLVASMPFEMPGERSELAGLMVPAYRIAVREDGRPVVNDKMRGLPIEAVELQ